MLNIGVRGALQADDFPFLHRLMHMFRFRNIGYLAVRYASFGQQYALLPCLFVLIPPISRIKLQSSVEECPCRCPLFCQIRVPPVLPFLGVLSGKLCPKVSLKLVVIVWDVFSISIIDLITFSGIVTKPVISGLHVAQSVSRGFRK